MKIKSSSPGLKTLFVPSSVWLMSLLIGLNAFSQTVDQTFLLQQGWNAIWLEVEPTNSEINEVFGDLPVESIWTFTARHSTVEFIQDQSEVTINESGWLGWFPEDRPEAFLSTLYRAHGLRPYLIKLTDGPVTHTITGRPRIRETRWLEDSFNLRGFPVDPSNQPSFGTFFSPSPAHNGQRMYHLSPNGQWQLVSASHTIQHGEAYWVYCHGTSTYPGPLEVVLELGETLDYGNVLTELNPRVCNHALFNQTVTMKDIASQASPLSYQSFTGNRLSWVDLPEVHSLTLASSDCNDVLLAMRRRDFSGNQYGSILEIKDSLGTRYQVPVRAEKLVSARPSLDGVTGGSTTAGLWVGTIIITNVNEVNTRSFAIPRPTRSPFDLRLILHVTETGETRLLKHVIQMFEEGTFTTDSQGQRAVDKPGRFVLITDDSLISQFKGAVLRDGLAVGRRLSTIDFDFDGGEDNIQEMSGELGIGNTVRTKIVLASNHPTNPFKHRFHTDHDNLDSKFEPITNGSEESYSITRNIKLEFTADDPGGNIGTVDTLDYGTSVIGGLYRETISGLHRRDIVSTGTFRLRRVSNSPVLNQ